MRFERGKFVVHRLTLAQAAGFDSGIARMGRALSFSDMSRRRHRFSEAKARAARQPRCGGCWALLVVDNAPLQKAAWRDLCQARKLLEKASRNLHRHEQVDLPAFRAWLGATFPNLLSLIRDLAMQFDAKERIVSAVEDEAFITRRSPRVVWQEWQRMEKNQSETGSSQGGPAHSNTDGNQFGDDSGADPWAEDFSRQEFGGMFEEFCASMGLDPNDPAVQAMRGKAPAGAGLDFPSMHFGPEVDEGREIYRRLVQQLHPDRGGEWTPQRARIWHQVQEAWAARDVDLLARLEAEWEIAADTLGPASPVGRLRAAVDEIHAARRDAESRVRRYRKAPEWRFSLSAPDVRRCEELRRTLEHERDGLRKKLDELEAILAVWEKPVKKRSRRGKIPETERKVECRPESEKEDLFSFDFGS
jgi:hypothetical protein